MIAGVEEDKVGGEKRYLLTEMNTDQSSLHLTTHKKKKNILDPISAFNLASLVITIGANTPPPSLSHSLPLFLPHAN